MIPPNAKYLIIGARKCGTTSLETYMRNTLKMDVVRFEQLFTRRDGLKYASRHYPDRIPIVILRNPIQRIESDFSYTPEGSALPHTNFIRYAIRPDYSYRWGDRNPITQSHYARWLKKWPTDRLIILNLHVMQRLPDFPQVNKTPTKRPLTKFEMQLAQELLNYAKERDP